MCDAYEAAQRGAFDVKWADGKRRSRFPSGHDNHAASRRQCAHSQIEVGFAQGFPPHVHSGRRQPFQLRLDILCIVMEDEIGAQLAAQLRFPIASGSGDDPGADGLRHLHHG